MFKENLKYLRKQKKYSQAQLGEYLGISDKTISSWESGRTEPNMQQLSKLSELFSVDMNDMLNRDLSLKADQYGNHMANLKHLASKPELLEIYNDIYESENLQILFDTARDLTPEDLEKVLAIIKLIHEENE